MPAALCSMEVFDERGGQHLHVRRGKVQSFRAGRWHDVSGIAGEEQSPVSQWLDHEAAQRRDALLDGWPGDQALHRVRIQPPSQLFPERRIAPLRHLVAERHLQVVTAARATAHRAQRETARAAHVDELIAHRRRFREQAKPAEGIDLLVFTRRARGQAGATHTVEAVRNRR